MHALSLEKFFFPLDNVIAKRDYVYKLTNFLILNSYR